MDSRKGQIFVGGIHRKVSFKDLESEFVKFGEISNFNPKKGFAFIV